MVRMIMSRSCLVSSRLNRPIYLHGRFCSSKSSQEKENKPSPGIFPNFKRILTPAVVSPKPIKSVSIQERIRKASKRGSMIRDLFLPHFDTDYLAYPEVMRSRHQFNELVKQEQMVNKFFKQLVMRDPEKQITTFGFNSLWVLSRTEMISIFENIGNSMAFKIDSQEKEDPSILQTQWNQILSLMINNICLTIIDESPNERLRNKVYAELNQNPSLKIGFAWKELGLTLTGKNICEDGTLETFASITVDNQFWLLNGTKEGIVLDPLKPDPDYYLTFARTNDFPQSSRPAYLLHQNVPFPGIVSVLIPKSCIFHHEDYVQNGIAFRRISFKDVLLPLEGCEVLPAEVDGVNAVNFKSFITLGMSALILGQMKSIMDQVNDFIVTKRAARIGCESFDLLQADLTKELYTVESCIYYSAAMFDQLEKKENPEIHLESTITSLITRESALNFLTTSRRIFGVERHDRFSPIINNVIRLTSFFEEPNFNRVKIVLDGLELLMEKKGRYMRAFAVSPGLNQDNMVRKLQIGRAHV